MDPTYHIQGLQSPEGCHPRGQRERLVLRADEQRRLTACTEGPETTRDTTVMTRDTDSRNTRHDSHDTRHDSHDTRHGQW